MIVTLDEATHTYRLPDGRTPPSVSQILNLYLPVPIHFMPADAVNIGTVRHQWFHALAQGLGLENEPDPRIAGAVTGFRKFLAEVKPRYISGEVPYFDDLLGVCGTPDLVAEIAGRLSVCDYKPEARAKRTRAQTAAYAVMLQHNKFMVLDRYELRLYADGSYRLNQHKDNLDLRRWTAMAYGYHAAAHFK